MRALHRSSAYQTSGIVHKAVAYNEKQEPIDCLFCRIHRREEPGSIAYEDERFVAFKTISPATPSLHLLVTPREHIRNIDSLSGPKDAELIREMVKIGRKSLGEFGTNAEFCFHIPPWLAL